MPRSNPFFHFDRNAKQGFNRKPGESQAAKGRYDASADGPLEFPSIQLQTPFSFDGNLAKRLVRREINPKEAFTVLVGLTAVQLTWGDFRRSGAS